MISSLCCKTSVFWRRQPEGETVCWEMILDQIILGDSSKLPIQSLLEIPAYLEGTRWSMHSVTQDRDPLPSFHPICYWFYLLNDSRMQEEKYFFFLFFLSLLQFLPWFMQSFEDLGHHHSIISSRLLELPVMFLKWHFIFLLATPWYLAPNLPSGWSFLLDPQGDHLAFLPHQLRLRLTASLSSAVLFTLMNFLSLLECSLRRTWHKLFPQDVSSFISCLLILQASVQILLPQESLAFLLPALQVMCPSYVLPKHFYVYLEFFGLLSYLSSHQPLCEHESCLLNQEWC